MSQNYSILAKPNTRASQLMKKLRAGLELLATRSDLELLSGPWSFHQELCEDGRATCVHHSAERQLFLTRDGMLMIALSVSEADDVYRCRWIENRPLELWKSLAALYPSLHPGRGGFRRFWVIREAIGHELNRWGVIDLRRFAVLGWCGHAQASALVEQLNAVDSRSAEVGALRPLPSPHTSF